MRPHCRPRPRPPRKQTSEADARFEQQVPQFDSSVLVQKFASVFCSLGSTDRPFWRPPPSPDWIRFSPRDRTTQQVRFMLQCLARDLTALDEPPSVYPLVVTDNAVQAEVSTCRHWTRPWMDGEVFERCLRGRDASVDAPPLPAGAHSTDWWIVRTTGSHYLNLHPYLQAACPPALKSSHGMHPRLD